MTWMIILPYIIKLYKISQKKEKICIDIALILCLIKNIGQILNLIWKLKERKKETDEPKTN